MPDIPADPPTPAGHLSRLVAVVLDYLLYLVILGAVGVGVFAAVFGTVAVSDESEVGGLLWLIAAIFLAFAVGTLVAVAVTIGLVARRGVHNGQSLGKQMLGIRTIREDRTAVGFGTVLARELLAKGLLVAFTASALTAVIGAIDESYAGIGLAIVVWYGPALFDERRRGLHDRICNTRVVVA